MFVVKHEAAGTQWKKISTAGAGSGLQRQWATVVHCNDYMLCLQRMHCSRSVVIPAPQYKWAYWLCMVINCLHLAVDWLHLGASPVSGQSASWQADYHTFWKRHEKSAV